MVRNTTESKYVVDFVVVVFGPLLADIASSAMDEK